MTSRDRRGVSLVELLIAMVVAVGFGAAMMTMMLSQNRFEERTEGQRSARRVSRAAINALTGDLRMVDPSWGVESLSASTVTFKIPYALGLICASTTTVQTIALLPVDSVTFALPGYSGFATRASDGTYSTISGGTLVESSSFPASCTTAGIQQLTAPSSAPNQKTRIITITLGSPLGAVIETGTPIMLYRRVSYYFGSSAQSGLTSRTALWRDYLDDAVAATEMVAPFDAAAAFKFWVSSSSSVQTSPPGTLTTLRGLEFYLPGESDRTSRQKSSPEEADMTTDVYFVNRAS